MTWMKSIFLYVFLGLCCSIVWAAEDAKPVFSLTTDDFLDEGILPVLYTCDGKNIAPQLSWENAPPKTKTFTILMTDLDALKDKDSFYHWVLFNIPAATKSLPEEMKQPPAGSVTGKNSWAKTQYDGPCPPKGSSHKYLITIYALDNSLSLTSDADAKAVVEAMDKHILGKASLKAVYSRWLR